MNIEHMIKLGKEGNLEQLEALREEMAQELFSQVGDPAQKRRLEQLHFKAKNIKARYRNPLVAAIKSSEMMIEKLGELNSKLNGVDNS